VRLKKRHTPDELLLRAVPSLATFALPALVGFLVLGTYYLPLVQHILYGSDAPSTTIQFAVCAALAVGCLSILQLVHTHIFVCPQATVVYSISKSGIKPANVEKKLAEIFSANPDADPKDFAAALGIGIKRYTKNKGGVAGQSEDVDVGDP
jgi:hypothetical protein